MSTPTRGILYKIFDWLNRLICRVLYHVRTSPNSPLPEKGPVLLVADHSAYSDPMVLAATAGRPIIFLTATEIYHRPFLKWFCKTVQYIPVQRGVQDIAAVRSLIRALRQDEVVAVFPEGGIDEFRNEQGHLGIGYLALKTGATVVPASITWDNIRPLTLLRSLCTPGSATIRYGEPITFSSLPNPKREHIEQATATMMHAIRALKDSQMTPHG